MSFFAELPKFAITVDRNEQGHYLLSCPIRGTFHCESLTLARETINEWMEIQDGIIQEFRKQTNTPKELK